MLLVGLPLTALVISANCGARVPGSQPVRGVSSAGRERDTIASSSIEIAYFSRPGLQSLLRMRLDDGKQVRNLREEDLALVEGGGGERQRSFEVITRDQIGLHAHVAFVQDGNEADTLSSLQFEVPVLPKRGYKIFVMVRPSRPCCWMVDSVLAAPFRRGAPVQPGDSLFVSWGYYIKGGPPS